MNLHHREGDENRRRAEVRLQYGRVGVRLRYRQFVPHERRCRRRSHARVVAREPLPVRPEQIRRLAIPIGGRVLDVLLVHLPRLRILPVRASVREEVVDLVRPEEEDPAQQEGAASLRVRLRVRQRERRPPRSAQHQSPSIYPEVRAQLLDVADELRGRVLHEGAIEVVGGVRRRLAGTALVEYDDAVELGVEETPAAGGASGAGTAVEEHRRHAVRVSRDVVVERVTVADVEMTRRVMLDLRIQDRGVGGGVGAVIGRGGGDVGHVGAAGGRGRHPRSLARSGRRER